MLNRIGYLAGVVGLIVGITQLFLWSSDVYSWLKPAPKKLSAADLLVIDQHPTELKLVKISRENINSDQFLSIYLKNTSTVTAKNAQLTFYNHKGLKYPYGQELTNLYDGSKTDIRAGATQKYTIASVKNYESFFGPSTPNAKLLRASTTIQSEKPFELEEIVCGRKNGGIASCSFNADGNSTILDIKYGSIFEQKYSTLTQFYNTFLNGEVKYLPDLTAR